MTAATSTQTGSTIAIAGGAPVRVLSARILTPWKGVWLVDLDLDPGPDPSTTVPTSGSAVLTIGASTTLTGTLDPTMTGRFGGGVKARLVAGGAGWDQVVAKQDFSNDGGIQSSDIEQQTAELVGETVVDSAPITLGTKWTRAAGPAKRVFEDPDRDWYVDPNGITQVASRPAATPDQSLEVLFFDPIAGRVDVSCDALVLPGTTLTDTYSPARWDGTLTVQKVEQTFTKDGSRAICWCGGAAIDPLLSALTSMVRELAGVATLRVEPYRLVQMAGKRLNLQAVDATQGEPDLQNVPVFGGMPGDSAVLANSTNVLVVFVKGQKSGATAIAYDATVPSQRTIDATQTVNVGPSAAEVDIAGGTSFVALAPDVDSNFDVVLAGVRAAITALAGPSSPVTNVQVAAAFTAMQTALVFASTAASKVKAT